MAVALTASSANLLTLSEALSGTPHGLHMSMGMGMSIIHLTVYDGISAAV